MSLKKLSIIISVYNEEGNLKKMYEVTKEVLCRLGDKWDYELLFVNDGSVDESSQILKTIADDDIKVKVINFSRNFGHEAAMIAGIDYAEGELMICMDADLQHPPVLISDIVKKYEAGNDVILLARAQNKDAGLIKNITSSLYYKVLNKLSDIKFEKNVSDFFAISRRVAEVLKQDYREKTRYLRGYVQSVGFRKCVIEYEASERFSGESKYSLKKLLKIAAITMNCFSVTPLKVGIYSSVVSIALMLLSFIYYIAFYVQNGYGSGTALLCCIITFMFSILFILMGTIGEYLGLLMLEVKNRPIYIVAEKVNFEEK